MSRLGKLTSTVPLFGKLETDVEIKAPASKFLEMFYKRPHHIANVSGDIVQGCEHDGDWGKVETIISFNYVHDGKAKVGKKVIEAIDVEKNMMSSRMIGGDILEHYKNFTFTLEAIPKGEGSVVHWTLEYEKLHENVPESHASLLQLCVDISKDIDAHLMEGN